MYISKYHYEKNGKFQQKPYVFSSLVCMCVSVMYFLSAPMAHATPHAQRHVLVPAGSHAEDIAAVVHVSALGLVCTEKPAEDAWDCAFLAFGVQLFHGGTACVAHATSHAQRDVLVSTRSLVVDVAAVVHMTTLGRIGVEHPSQGDWDGTMLAFGVEHL